MGDQMKEKLLMAAAVCQTSAVAEPTLAVAVSQIDRYIEINCIELQGVPLL